MARNRRFVKNRKRIKRFFKKRFGGKGTRKLIKNKGTSLMYNGPGRAPLPDKYYTKVTYTDWFNAASGGVSGIFDNVFRGNGPRDPDQTGTGIGVNGFTEFAAIYNKYRVYASKINVSMKSITDITSTGDAVGMVIPDRSSTSYTLSTMLTRIGSPYAKSGMLNRYANGASPLYLKQFRRTKDIYSETDIDDDVYASTTGTEPANQWYWHVMAGRQDQSSISASPGFCYMIKITYYVRWEQRKALSAP